MVGEDISTGLLALSLSYKKKRGLHSLLVREFFQGQDRESQELPNKGPKSDLLSVILHTTNLVVFTAVGDADGFFCFPCGPWFSLVGLVLGQAVRYAIT